MWNDWLSSLTGPSADQHVPQPEIVEPIETPRRFTNPAQIERLQNLQSQHQQLQVQQLHLLHKQFKLQRELGCSMDSTCTEGSSSGLQSPLSAVSGTLADVVKNASESKKDDMRSSGLKSETEETAASSEHGNMDEGANLSPEVWQQFHALQAQQWAQALNQARIAKRQPTGPNMTGASTPLSGGTGLGLLPTSSGSSGISGGKRCKAYAAPKGVWKNNGGYNATIYVHKRRIYGPIRRDLSDAIEDRKEMEEALRELTAIHNSPEDAAILEVEMREVVAGLRNRSTPNRPEGGSGSSSAPIPSGLVAPTRMLGSGPVNPEGPRKRLRLVGNPGSQGGPMDHLDLPDGIAQSPDVLGPFAAPLQIKPEDDHMLSDSMFHHESHHMHSEGEEHDHGALSMMHLPRGVGYTPSTGPIRDVYGSPGMFGGPGLMDDASHLDMLPDSLGSMWGPH